MATATAKLNPATAPLPFANRIVSVNAVPDEFDLASGLPAGFLEFLAPLHAALTLRQRALIARRERALADAHAAHVAEVITGRVVAIGTYRHRRLLHSGYVTRALSPRAAQAGKVRAPR